MVGFKTLATRPVRHRRRQSPNRAISPDGARCVFRLYGMPSRKRAFMVTRRGGLPPDHTKSPARRERARKAGENDVSAGAVTERASSDASGGFNFAKLEEMLVGKFGKVKGEHLLKALLANSGIPEGAIRWRTRRPLIGLTCGTVIACLFVASHTGAIAEKLALLVKARQGLAHVRHPPCRPVFHHRRPIKGSSALTMGTGYRSVTNCHRACTASLL